MSTVSPDSKRDKIRQVETFPQPHNAKRQLPKPPACGSPSAWERGGWPRRGWKRKTAIKQDSAAGGTCATSFQLASMTPNSAQLPWWGFGGCCLCLGYTPPPAQTAPGSGEQGESIAQISQAHHTSEQAGEDQAAVRHGADVQHRGMCTGTNSGT